MAVDYQVLFNIAFTAAGFLGGWVLNNMTKAIDRSKDDFKDMRDEMRHGFDKIDTTLGTIFKRLERKEDKN